MEKDDERGGAFFGRRKGKKLRARHQGLMAGLLPKLQVHPASDFDPRALFDFPIQSLRLEIGFGGGEHLAAEAQAHPATGFIGCEPFINGVAKLLAEVEQRGLLNVRIYPADVMDVVNALPGRSIDRIDILYPDPGPKTRQQPRRLVNDDRLRVLARILKPGGLLCFASDIASYCDQVRECIGRSDAFSWMSDDPATWLLPWAGWPGTRYEAKALREGRTPAYYTFVRR